MKKIIFCLMAVFALTLTSCGGDKGKAQDLIKKMKATEGYKFSPEEANEAIDILIAAYNDRADQVKEIVEIQDKVERNFASKEASYSDEALMLDYATDLASGFEYDDKGEIKGVEPAKKTEYENAQKALSTQIEALSKKNQND